MVCGKDVCERWCVTNMVCDKGVTEEEAEEATRRRRRGGGDAEDTRGADLKTRAPPNFWGNMSYRLFLGALSFPSVLFKSTLNNVEMQGNWLHGFRPKLPGMG